MCLLIFKSSITYRFSEESTHSPEDLDLEMNTVTESFTWFPCLVKMLIVSSVCIF